MSTNDARAYQGTESLKATPSPVGVAIDRHRERSRDGLDYGDLVARAASELDLSAAEAKQHIAREGRAAVLEKLR